MSPKMNLISTSRFSLIKDGGQSILATGKYNHVADKEFLKCNLHNAKIYVGLALALLNS